MSIPLTFDWLTLSWLKLRAGLWWRRARLNPLVLALLLVGVCSGCVPAARFEETQSAAQVELEGRRRAEYGISQLQAENVQLRAQLSQQGSTLVERDQALAQAELDGSTQGKQRQDAEGMVEQLRGELARVGGHLQAFNDDKQRLEAARVIESERGRAMSRLSRDAALLLREPLATGDYSLDAETDGIVLRIPRDKLLLEDGNAKPEAESTLKAVAQILSLHKQFKLRVQDSTAPADPIVTSNLTTALATQIPADRFEPIAVDPPSTPAAPGDAPATITFSFRLP